MVDKILAFRSLLTPENSADIDFLNSYNDTVKLAYSDF